MPKKYDYEKVIGKLEESNVIYIGIQKETDMATVNFNDKCVMMGNFWDFHPDCHGITSIPDFRSFGQLADEIELHCKKEGKKVGVIRDLKWKYPY